MRNPEKITITDLEKIKLQIRKTSGIMLNLDMEDRWGPKDDASFARRQKELDKQEMLLEKSKKQLADIVKSLRKGNPDLLEQWAGAHIELLNQYIAKLEKKNNEEKYRVELFTARSEINEWESFARGEADEVEQNIFYISYDKRKFRELFGLDI